MEIRKNIFTSSGIVYIKDNIIKFCCDSFNFPEEIDRDRAEQSLKRDKSRKNNKEKNNIDIERAKRAEARAKARLELKYKVTNKWLLYFLNIIYKVDNFNISVVYIRI